MSDTRWWQWPTVLSLDAPAVSAVWLACVARSLHVALHWPAYFVLATAVWLAYAADRWIEGWRLTAIRIRTQRHRFYQRWRWPLLMFWLAMLASSVGVAVTSLPRVELAVGGVLATAVITYVVSHQFLHRQHRWRVPKEICIAGLLTAGAGLFLIRPGVAFSGVVAAMPPLAVFAAACFANCALISRWERDVDLAQEQSSLATGSRWAPLIPWIPWGLMILGVSFAIAGDGQATRLAASCAALSGLLLGLIDRLERHIGWSAAHVLADVALMTPVIPLVWR